MHADGDWCGTQMREREVSEIGIIVARCSRAEPFDSVERLVALLIKDYAEGRGVHAHSRGGGGDTVWNRGNRWLVLHEPETDTVEHIGGAAESERAIAAGTAELVTGAAAAEVCGA